MFCLNCGSELPANAAFCNQCGTPAGAPAPAAEQTPPAEPGGYALYPNEFISPTDEAAMRTLQGMGELNRLIQTFVNKYGKPWLESGFLGNGVKIGPNQFPLLFDLAAELGEIFCLQRLPDVYVANFMFTPISIARTSRSCTIGTDSESFIVLDARYIMPLMEENISAERLRDDPIYFMLAHEFSHVALGHALYLSVVLWIAEHGPTGLTGLTIRPLVMPLQHWGPAGGVVGRPGRAGGYGGSRGVQGIPFDPAYGASSSGADDEHGSVFGTTRADRTGRGAAQ